MTPEEYDGAVNEIASWSNDDKFPLHNVNGKYTAFQVKIGDVVLGENPSIVKVGTQPNPIKISWSRTNVVKVHEIPYPNHKTIRVSKKTLYKLTMNFKTLRSDIFNSLLDKCEMTGPHYIQTGTRPSPKWMYITDYNFDQNQGFDDDYIEWNITFQEVND
jgi:hypothetical protein